MSARSISLGTAGIDGLRSPGDPSPDRRPNSMRRTSTIDLTFDGSYSQLTLRGSGRDLATDRDLSTRILDTAESEVVIDIESRTIGAISTTPLLGGSVHALVGLPAGSGFRRAFRREVPELSTNGSLLGLLLDEVPVAMVISGSLLRRRPNAAALMQSFDSPLDVCAGWARGGLLAATTLATGSPCLDDGPIVPAISSSPDGYAWHPLTPMPAWSMRRARRLDIAPSAASDGTGLPSAGYDIDAFFRDSRVTDDGVERGVHEYRIRATLDREGTVLDMCAVPHVLPAPECPAAAASARRLIGLPLRQLREQVTSAFLGTSTCTHLNDALRVLSDLDSLINRQSGNNEWMQRG